MPKLQDVELACLLTDPLTEGEEQVDLQTRQLRFDAELLTGGIMSATKWVSKTATRTGKKTGYFVAGTGAAAC